jgi:hypothetical protein
MVRQDFEDIESRLETWNGCVKTVLHRDGPYEVYEGSKHDPGTLVGAGGAWAG